MGQEESSIVEHAENNLENDNLESSIASRIDIPPDIINSDEQTPKKVMCPHCEETIATYRCKLELEDMAQVYEHSKLLAYWVPGIRSVKGVYIVSYVGCDKCMLDKCRRPFTHVPGGWIDELFVDETYEDAKLE